MPEERKLVSVLFADVVGSTAITLARDPEVVRSTMRRIFDELRPIIEAHGGTVEKFIGDEIMAVFGVPAVHDDDADRAVRAAVAIRDRVRELSASSASIRVELRIGVNTGETVADTGDRDQFLVTGEPVIAAARIRASAELGEIVVGLLTHRLTKDGVSYASSRTVEAKGIGRIEIFPVRALRSEVPAPQRGIVGLRAPIVGRDAELRVLGEAVARVGGERAPMLVAIYGEAGVGKSRLIGEFTASLPQECVRIGRCLPYGDGITLYPLQQILRADAGITLTATRDEALAVLGSAIKGLFAEDEPSGDAIFRRLCVVLGFVDAREALADVPEHDLMEELRWGVRRYLERRATDPLIVVFEDLHWAEQALVELVEHLAEWSRAPLLIVCLARPEFRDRRPTFGSSAANAVAITLSPLNADDSRRLIHELLRIEALPDTIRSEVIARAEGNPLYVEEFLRTLIETGRIARVDGRWVAVGEISDVEIPPTLQGLITARLDRLSPPVKYLLQCGSIVGRLFSTSALEAIGGSKPEASLVREAARSDLIIEVDERAPGTGRVHRFRHALFAEVAYSTIPKADRARMHDNYGRWLEATLGDRAEEVAEVLAHHAEQAYRYAAELEATDVQELGARALTRLVAVADRAYARDDRRAAWRLFERATLVAEATNADLATRAHVRGSALLGRHNYSPKSPDAERQLEEAVSLARAAGPSRVLVMLLRGRSKQAILEGDLDRAKNITAELPALARATGDFDLVSDILCECGEDAREWGDEELAQRYYLEAVEAGKQGARAESIAYPLLRLAGRASEHGDFTEAAAYERKAAALGAPSSALQRSRMALGRSRRAYQRGDHDVAIQHATQGLAAAREVGAPDWIVAFNELMLGRALLGGGGDAARAREVLEDGAANVEAHQSTGFIPEFRASAAIACVLLGEHAGARANLAAAKAALLSTDLESEAITAIAEAAIERTHGDPSEAVRTLEAALSRLEPTSRTFHTAQLRIALGEALMAAGRMRDAEASLVRARDFFRDPLAKGRQEQIDALLARAQATAG